MFLGQAVEIVGDLPPELRIIDRLTLGRGVQHDHIGQVIAAVDLVLEYGGLRGFRARIEPAAGTQMIFETDPVPPEGEKGSHRYTQDGVAQLVDQLAPAGEH